jgi:eukaryotic-like serine/threonine-protein kinase
MTPERWNKLEALFNEALELQGEARSAHLTMVCGDDGWLRDEAEKLIAAHEMEGSFIDSPILAEIAGLTVASRIESPVGRRIGPYQVISQIARGGMGEVFLAEDIRLERKVALKVLPADFTRSPERVRRFEREAKAASALNHPNILTIHEIGEADGEHYIVSEFVEGETMRERMRRGPLSLTAALDAARQVAGALAAAHSAGIAHRDIKPENVMARPDGLVKILDFGLAKLTEERRDRETEGSRNGETGQRWLDTLSVSLSLGPSVSLSLTSPGMVMGTAHYMSPEQARGLKVDNRTDIFSLGVMLYEMLTGRRPFEGATASDVIAAILTKEPEPLEELRSEAGPELARAVMRCLAKDREERFQTAGEFAAQLKAATERGEQSPPGETRRTQDSRAARHEPDAFLRSRPRWIAATLALLMIAVAAYWKLARHSASDPQIRSLAVLPLENLSGDPAQEYLADGMTDALIGDLAKIGALRVISRTSAMRYKGEKKPLPEIAGELNVDAVVEGAVQRSGDRISIRARLIHAGTDRQLWAESYERDFSDALGMQSEIARAIAREVQAKLTPAEQARLASARPVNHKAYNDYLLGIYYWNKRTEEHVRKAIDYFQSAIREDPGYAQAHAGLADSYSVLAVMFGDSGEFFPKAKAAATKAIEIDGTLAEAHVALAGFLAYYDWDWQGAEREFNRAIELNPGSSIAHLRYAHFLATMGRTEKSLAESMRALYLDPVSLIINTGLGQRLYNARLYDKASRQLQKTLEMDPNFFLARIELGRVYAQQGRYVESLAELKKAVELSRDSALAEIGYVYAVSDQRREAREILAELLELSRRRYVSPVDIALIHAGLGEKDQAFNWLEKAYGGHSSRLTQLNMDPRIDTLRADPRFDDLLRRMGLPQ